MFLLGPLHQSISWFTRQISFHYPCEDNTVNEYFIQWKLELVIRIVSTTKQVQKEINLASLGKQSIIMAFILTIYNKLLFNNEQTLSPLGEVKTTFD